MEVRVLFAVKDGDEAVVLENHALLGILLCYDPPLKSWQPTWAYNINVRLNKMLQLIMSDNGFINHYKASIYLIIFMFLLTGLKRTRCPSLTGWNDPVFCKEYDKKVADSGNLIYNVDTI